jgi:basic membrane protein A and related proteins
LTLKSDYSIPVDFYPEVTVPALTNLVDGLAKQGFNLIWIHGGQFEPQAYSLAGKYPNISFIVEGDIRPDTQPKNLWFIDRNFQQGIYVMARLAVEQTRTGKIGYICGLTLPFSYIEVHAIQQAIQDSGKTVDLVPVWTGDLNDPVLARAATAKLLDQNVDVIIGSLNLGMEGLVDEVNSRPNESWFTGKYMSKAKMSPGHFMASLEMDFSDPLHEIITSIANGERTGYYGMDFGKGLRITQPVGNVSEETSTHVNEWIGEVTSGQILVNKNELPLDIPTQTP